MPKITEERLKNLVKVSTKDLWICSECGYRGNSYSWQMKIKATPKEYRLIAVYCPKCKTGGKL